MTISRLSNGIILVVFLALYVSCANNTRSSGGVGLPLIHSSPSAGAPITLSVKDAKLSDVLMWIADQAGLTSDMRMSDDKITMSVKGAKLSDIMNDLCYAYECEWRIDSGKLIVSGRKD